MEKNIKPCHSLKSTMIDASVSKPLYVRIKKIFWNLFPTLVSRLRNNSQLRNINDKIGNISPSISMPDSLNLKPGEWVEVLSFDEISKTLNRNGKYKGLFFMPEMAKFCGGKFKIFKKVTTVRLESTGEVRKFKSSTFILEGVYCDGENFAGCGRTCFHFWREVWLKRISDK